MGNTAYLNDIRRRLGLKSDAALARVLGVSPQHVKEVKRGHRQIGAPLQAAIAAALDAAEDGQCLSGHASTAVLCARPPPAPGVLIVFPFTAPHSRLRQTASR